MFLYTACYMIKYSCDSPLIGTLAKVGNFSNICTIYNNLYLKNKPYYSFKIKQRSDDFSYILVKIDFSLKGKREP